MKKQGQVRLKRYREKETEGGLVVSQLGLGALRLLSWSLFRLFSCTVEGGNRACLPNPRTVTEHSPAQRSSLNTSALTGAQTDPPLNYFLLLFFKLFGLFPRDCVQLFD